jgi:subtilase family serine protease
MRHIANTLCTAAATFVVLAVLPASSLAVPLGLGNADIRQATQVFQAPPTTSQCLATIKIHCYGPLQMQKAYDMGPLYQQGFNGKGRTIVVVDSFGSPTIHQDLASFDAAYGLPAPPSLTELQPAGPVPPYDNSDDRFGWAFETTLDVEYAHAMAPGANIVVVETPVSETEGVTGLPEIDTGENFVLNHNIGDVISQSFGATEDTFPSKASILGLRGPYINAAARGVTVLGSSGDEGATDFMNDLETLYDHPVNSFPSSDPLVTSVGGTQLNLDDAGNRLSPDVTWNEPDIGATGGGPSHVFGRPVWQDLVHTGSGVARATPDVSMSAAVDGGVLVFLSADPAEAGFHVVGGTSESSPLFSGVVAVADQVAGHRLGLISPRMYALSRTVPNAFVDVTQGDNSFAGVTGFPAGTGYDMSTGLGTIDGARFVHLLAGR